mgnify:CR=1 FL=1
MSQATETLKKVPLFAGLDKRELEEIASSMRERRFKAGDTMTQEGSGGAAFFVVEEGEAEGGLEAVRASIEHVIPKARGTEFTELMSVHAKELCVEGTPNCPACPLKSDCPTGQEVLAAAKKSPEGKPRPKSR